MSNVLMTWTHGTWDRSGSLCVVFLSECFWRGGGGGDSFITLQLLSLSGVVNKGCQVVDSPPPPPLPYETCSDQIGAQQQAAWWLHGEPLLIDTPDKVMCYHGTTIRCSLKSQPETSTHNLMWSKLEVNRSLCLSCIAMTFTGLSIHFSFWKNK